MMQLEYFKKFNFFEESWGNALNIWIYAVIVIAGYLLGSINVAIMYIRRRYGVDVRTEGSGNAGATNVARTHGLGAGLLTLGSDML